MDWTAAEAANLQGKYWEMHDFLFAHQFEVNSVMLDAFERRLTLDERTLQGCLSSPTSVAAIREDELEGRRLGVAGTPTFFVGRLTSDRKVVEITERFSGVPSIAFLGAAIARANGGSLTGHSPVR